MRALVENNAPSPPRSARHLSPKGRGWSKPHPSRAKPTGALKRARAMRKKPTDAEAWLWTELRKERLNGYRFSRQVPLGRYIADFVCRKEKLIVEVDGSQHAESTHDALRTDWLNRNGYSVLRFWNEEVLKQRTMVLNTILATLDKRLPPSKFHAPAHPLPRGERCRAQRGGEGMRR
ncbi:endonuclease domain-containing protein [Notoacmeibacter sp. MSK16QG-6]|uniref:endonuclease domain-containing protein n=1 Tax=Notoacmeibacter sp. MSK16QG-6 TaxID=2957982 RepID=UPI0035309AB3